MRRFLFTQISTARPNIFQILRKKFQLAVSNRIIAALADAHYGKCLVHIERYQEAVQSQGHAIINSYDKLLKTTGTPAEQTVLCEKANAKIAVMLKKETQSVLDKVLFESSSLMKNAFARSDA